MLRLGKARALLSILSILQDSSMKHFLQCCSGDIQGDAAQFQPLVPYCAVLYSRCCAVRWWQEDNKN